MISYKEFLNETLKLKHLTHIEDTIIVIGVKGAKDALETMEKTIDKLSGTVNDDISIAVKADGAPAIIAGIDPGNGRFFVATKSLFNKTPKINYSNEDIDKNHTGEGLNKKLKIALKYLPKAYPKKGVFQADFMFIKSDIKKEKYKDKKYITFTPNTITYALEEDSKLAKRAIKTEVCIAIHTVYSGNTIKELSAGPGIDMNLFKQSSDVWIYPTELQEEHILFTEKESKRIKDDIELLKTELNKFKKKDIDLLSEYSIEIMAYLNGLVKDNKVPNDNPVGEFMVYLNNKEIKNISKYKSEKGREKKRKEYEILKKNIRNMGGTLYYMILWNKKVYNIKAAVLKKVNELQSFTTLTRKGNTFIPTNPEGMVIVDRLNKTFVKVIDRLEFSRNNFLISNF